MVKQILLSKNCIVCGSQKPISAFLQISGPQGTSYGNVCATCRGSTANNKTVVIEQTEEESGSSSFGLKIDSKAKMQIDHDKQEVAEKKQILEKEERDDKLESTQEKEERKELHTQDEKKHREGFLEKKKSESFFTRKIDSSSPLIARTIQEKQNLDKNVTKEQVAKTETQHQEQAAKQDIKDKGLDLSDLATDQLIGGKIKNYRLNQLKSWFGAAPMGTVERQFNAAQTDKQRVENSGSEDALVDIAKENWEPTSPGSKRR